jgi:hypothetical protein
VHGPSVQSTSAQVIFDVLTTAAPKHPSSELVSASGETDVTDLVAEKRTSNLFDSMCLWPVLRPS